MSYSKATRQQLKRHNQQLILRCIYQGIATNRAALALETGLAKPTVSEIVAELIERGFIEETGHGESSSSGGKRPVLLRFVATARQIIGVSIREHDIIACLANLDGNLVAQHQMNYQDAPLIPPLNLVQYAINALIAQLDASLLCISIGAPGIVDPERGIVLSSPLLNWNNLPLGDHLSTFYDVPIYVSNNTELVARSQIAYEPNHHPRHLVTVLVNGSVEIGIALGTDTVHHGSELGTLPLLNQSATGGQRLLTVSALTWAHIRERLRELRTHHPSHLLGDDASFLTIRYAVLQQDPLALTLLDEIAQALAQVYAWIIGIMRPDEISLTGHISDLGLPLLQATQHHLQRYCSAQQLNKVSLTAAEMRNRGLRGAVAYALQQELGIV